MVPLSPGYQQSAIIHAWQLQCPCPLSEGLWANLHAADAEAQGGLMSGSVLGLSPLDVARVPAGIPGVEAHLDVYDAGVPVMPRQVLHLYHAHAIQLYKPICSTCLLSGSLQIALGRILLALHAHKTST